MALDGTCTVSQHEPAPRGSRSYWFATGLFCLIFVVSVALTVFDPGGTRLDTERLGYPGWVIYPQAVAKPRASW